MYEGKDSGLESELSQSKMISADPSCFAEHVAKCCYDHYSHLPKTGKPKQGCEWTALSCFLKEHMNEEQQGSFDLEVVSIGTGTKCIGQSSMDINGHVLNDSHAEVMARRGLLRYLYYELLLVFQGKESSVISISSENGMGKIKNGVKFHFFTSHSPCGDASIIQKEIILDDSVGSLIGSNNIESLDECLSERKINFETKGQEILIPEKTYQIFKTESKAKEFQRNPTTLLTTVPLKRKLLDIADSKVKCSKISALQFYASDDIHRTGAKCVPEGGIVDPYLPGSSYHVLGAVRTKPGRGDPTLSVSCSDKLMRWCSVGVEGALLAYFFTDPVQISSITVGGGCPFSHESMNRAIIKRIDGCRNDLKRGITNLPQIFHSTIPFQDGRYDVNGKMKDLSPCPSSIIWCKVKERELEVAVNGWKQGVTKKRLGTPTGRLLICKRELFSTFFEVLDCRKKFLNSQNKVDNLSKDKPYINCKDLASDYKESWKKVLRESSLAWPKKSEAYLQFKVDS